MLLHPPFRLLYRDYDDAVGGLREDYAAWALTQAGLPFTYLKSTRGEKCPDFLLKIEDREVVIEVGGRGKGRQQFKGLGRGVKKRILRAEPPYRGDDLPLWVLGCM